MYLPVELRSAAPYRTHTEGNLLLLFIPAAHLLSPSTRAQLSFLSSPSCTHKSLSFLPAKFSFPFPLLET